MAEAFIKEVIKLDGYPRPVVSNKGQFFFVIFGRNYSRRLVLDWIGAQPIILKSMDKWRLWIGASKTYSHCFCGEKTKGVEYMVTSSWILVQHHLPQLNRDDSVLGVIWTSTSSSDNVRSRINGEFNSRSITPRAWQDVQSVEGESEGSSR